MITQSSTNTAKTPAKEFNNVTKSVVVMAQNTNRRGAFLMALSTNTKRVRFSFGTEANQTSAPLEAATNLSIDSSYTGPVAVCSDDLSTAISVYTVEW